jgi:HEAT repeat protein
MKNAIAFTLAFGFLTACSQGGSGGGQNGLAVGPKGEVKDPSTQQFKESYRLNLNGCDTGKHDFGSDASADDVKKQLCQALQDDDLNASCAEPLRKEFFDKKCGGMAWTPKYKIEKSKVSTPPPAPMNQVNQGVDSSIPDLATLNAVRDVLSKILVEKYEVNSELTNIEKQDATKLAEDMMSCGLSYLGPKCLSYQIFAGYYNGIMSKIDGKYVFYSEIKLNIAGPLIAMVFTMDQVQPSVKVSALEVSRILKPRDNQPLDQYLQDRSALNLLVKITPTNDFESAAIKRIQNPRDVRELYLVSKMLLENRTGRDGFQGIKAAVVSAFTKNKAIIIQASDDTYQEAVLSFITERLELKQSTLIDICEGLIKSPSKNVKQIAATIILDARPARTELKPIVLSTLKNERWDVRKKAVSALSKVQKTTAEENKLIEVISDSDADVRKEAVTAASKISVTDSHLAVVTSLSTDENWEVRIEAAKLLSRISSPASLRLLIGMMRDSDDDVRRQVNALLAQKNPGSSSTADFAEQMKSDNWDVRSQAAVFLGKVGTDQAMLVLINKMDDSDDDVRATIMKQLSAAPMKDSYVHDLSAKYSSENWDVRKNVSILLGKNTSISATKALIAHMDDSDADVQAQIASLLEGRVLPNSVVDVLAKNFSSENWEVRRVVAKLLGKIKSPASSSALEKQLTKESDDEVKTQIISSLKTIKG